MKIIDAIGKPCPIPVIETKKAIRDMEKAGGEIEITVDNDIARQNLQKLAEEYGFPFVFEKVEKDNIKINISVIPGASLAQTKSNDDNLVVSIGSDEMGSGDPDLSKTLMKAFVYSLTELDTLPKSILLYNRGAYLSNKDSDVLVDLKTLEEKGVIIKTCGACVNFYKIENSVEVGSIANMYDIVMTMAASSTLIQL